MGFGRGADFLGTMMRQLDARNAPQRADSNGLKPWYYERVGAAGTLLGLPNEYIIEAGKIS
jgi:hypothetical protein